MPLLPVSPPLHTPKSPADLITCSQGTGGASPCPGTRWWGGHSVSPWVQGGSLPACAGKGSRRPGRHRTAPAAAGRCLRPWVLLGFGSLRGSGRDPLGCYCCIGTVRYSQAFAGRGSSALISDVLYNLPAHRLKIMTVFRANDQPGVAGGRCNTGRLGAMPTAFHRCPAHTALPASPPVTRGNLLGSFSLC